MKSIENEISKTASKMPSINMNTVSTTLLIMVIVGGFTFFQKSSQSWAVQEQVNQRVDVTFGQIAATLESLNEKLETGTSDRYTAEIAKKDNQILKLEIAKTVMDLEIKILKEYQLKPKEISHE